MLDCKKLTYYLRQQSKTSEGEFIFELLNSYELSPKLSEQILLSAREHLLREHLLKEVDRHLEQYEQVKKLIIRGLDKYILEHKRRSIILQSVFSY